MKSLVGRKATIYVGAAEGGLQVSGKVTFVSPEVDPVLGQVRFWAEFENADLSIRPGMIASLTIGE